MSAAPEKQSRFLALQRVNRAYVARRYAIVVSRGWHGRAPGNEVTLTHIPEESRDWILAYVPIRALNYQTGDESGAPRISRARAYAARSGPLPPGIAKYGKYAIRRGFKQAYVADGNHRVMAATLRGDLAIRMYMPLPDYAALVRAVGGQISRPTRGRHGPHREARGDCDRVRSGGAHGADGGAPGSCGPGDPVSRKASTPRAAGGHPALPYESSTLGVVGVRRWSAAGSE